ncbi:hypothetical protein [Streptomyces sp. NPDC021224]|uniref:hypothetical protein n=1 Tax=unclassified Streptomyces TaxID=2593676 RepID=UPI00379FA09C
MSTVAPAGAGAGARAGSGVRAGFGAVAGVALADLRDRIRRPSFAVTLLAAVALGWLAVPAPGAHWVVLQISDHRGTYNSAYVGLATALAGTLWLALGGFYVVRGAPARDESSGVGRLLAATPLRTTAYFAGKLLGNVLVLASMLGVLAVTAPVMQLLRGKSRTVDPVALLLPFAVVALPVIVAVAAAALLADTVPGLRGGLGNVLWFFVWLTLAFAGQGPHAPLGGIGVHEATRSMEADLLAQAPGAHGEFSLGFTYTDTPLHTFTWDGFTPTAHFLLGRAALVALAVLCALLPGLWFARFDPARTHTRRGAAAPVSPVSREQPAAPRPTVPVQGPLTPARTGGLLFPRLYAAELRILVQGARWWWWSTAAVLTLTAFAATGSGATRFVLPAAWIWPVLLWSRLGSQAAEHRVDALLGAAPRPHRRVLAEWAAGVTLTAATGLGPAAVLLRDGDSPGVACWLAATAFVPSFALALGTRSRSHRLFQALYVPLWYGAANGLGALDFMGTTRAPGTSATLPPAAVAALSVLLLASVLVPLLRAPAAARLSGPAGPGAPR